MAASMNACMLGVISSKLNMDTSEPAEFFRSPVTDIRDGTALAFSQELCDASEPVSELAAAVKSS
jgi:hypothetical protein